MNKLASKAMKCTVCQRTVEGFKRFRGRANAQCPHCGSMDRHRAVIVLLERFTTLFESRPKLVLHISAERALTRRIFNHETQNAPVPAKVDITRMPHHDNLVDFVLHNHVMEHVVDDKAGFRECCRVLKPGGTLAFSVPPGGEEILEGPRSKEDRIRLYGQANHVRRYGSRDTIERLLECGFATAEFLTVGEQLTASELKHYALMPELGLYLAKKHPIQEGAADVPRLVHGDQ